jgi:2-polyprenyl-3-methyl-5-hydroxy-6-metoxy-1,4-benzoquinol methylase
MDGVVLPAHWNEVYRRTLGQGVSWFEAEPATSLATIKALPQPIGSVVDIGGGASALVDGLLAAGVADVTVLDVSQEALSIARERLADQGADVHWVTSDVLEWNPRRSFDVWHDRAVFHFVTDVDDRARYVEKVAAALRPGGHAVIATFAPDGPERCSNLPVARYSADDLADCFGPGFERVTAFRDVHVTPSGVEQPFTWIVLRRTLVDA